MEEDQTNETYAQGKKKTDLNYQRRSTILEKYTYETQKPQGHTQAFSWSHV